MQQWPPSIDATISSKRIRYTRFAGRILFSASIVSAAFLGFLGLTGFTPHSSDATKEEGTKELNSQAETESVNAIKILKPLTGQIVEFASKKLDPSADTFWAPMSDDSKELWAGALTCSFLVDESYSKKMRDTPAAVFQPPETIQITDVEERSEAINHPGQDKVVGFHVDRIYSLDHPHVKKLKCGRTFAGKYFEATKERVLKLPAAEEINKVLAGLAEVSTN